MKYVHHIIWHLQSTAFHEIKESEEKAGIDAEDLGYEEAYKVSKEEEEASGYDW